jgi:dihydrodipicolinate synthase/N-acetylneuraminate lyase
MQSQGIFVPVATPFDYRGEVYPSKIHYNLSRWNRTAVSGYVVGSAWGEARLLTAADRRKLWEQAAQAADPQKVRWAAVSVDGVHEAVEAIEEARSLGYQAAVVEPPRPVGPGGDNPETQLLFFRTIADRVSLPVLLKNPPAVSSEHLSTQTVVTLAGHPNIAGIIDSTGNIAELQQLIQKAPEGFQVLSGADRLLCEALEAGATAVPALANPLPFFCLSIAEAVRTREFASARELQQRAAAANVVLSRYGVAGL